MCDALIQRIETDDPELADLLRRRLAAHARKAREAARGPTVIELPDARPVGVLLIGDPHVDDDGCDLAALMADVQRIDGETVRGVCLGDVTNNWVGKLERLWKHQSTTHDEAVRLLEWLLHAAPWDGMCLGNHDIWNAGSSLIRYVSRGARIRCLRPHEVRIEYHAPGCEPVRLHVRHQFRGKSQYNKAHGLKKAAIWDGWADIYAQGHTHCWEDGTTDYADGRVRTVVQVGAYKRYDSYADELGFHQSAHGRSCLLLVDPSVPPTAPGRVLPYWDVRQGLAVLGALRGADDVGQPDV